MLDMIIPYLCRNNVLFLNMHKWKLVGPALFSQNLMTLQVLFIVMLNQMMNIYKTMQRKYWQYFLNMYYSLLFLKYKETCI